MKYELGKKYRDKVTGIEGVTIGCTTYITGCDTYGLQKEKDGECLTVWFGEGRLELVESPKITAKAKKNGGPQPTPMRGNPR